MTHDEAVDETGGGSRDYPTLEQGVYVHFPWCLKKCPYCDFVSFATPRESIDHEGYANAVIAEVERRAALLERRPVSSVFFGGGTPSLWRARELGRVLGAVLERAGATGDVEVTVECNPTSLDEGHARALRDVGVNRLSIGVQGLDEGRLGFLGRLHSPAGGLDAVRAALRVADLRVSADLIFGVAAGSEAAAQTPENAAAEARALADTGVTHISAYSLTIEPGTRFGELASRGRLPIAPDDLVADAFLAIDETLVSRGFEHYEISNYARGDARARHNVGYWLGRDYIGLGSAAFGTHELREPGESHTEQTRRWARRYRNDIDPASYMRKASSGADIGEIEIESELLDGETRLRERIMLGLRLRDGFDIEDASASVGAAPWTPSRRRAAERLVASGRLIIEGSRLRVPRRAWFLADGTAAALF